MTSRVVVGSSVAAMAAVERLAAAGETVRWLVTGSVGGAFAAMTVEGRHVGMGLRLIEREYVAGENQQPMPPLHQHVPGHAGHRPWMAMVAGYLDHLLPDLTPAPTPRLVLGDRVVEDFTLTGRLAAISELVDRRTCARIAADAAEILRSTGPAGVLESPGPSAMTLREASIRNHGDEFHRIVVEPIANALVSGGGAVVEAVQRHKVWAPIYWPRTLLEAASGASPSFDPQRTFWTDRNGGMSDVVVALERRIAACAAVTRLDVGRLRSAQHVGAATVLAFESGHAEQTPDAILATSPAETFAAASIPYHADRVSMSLLWLDVEERHVVDPAATTFLDDDIVFRVTATSAEPDIGGTARRTFAVELRTGARVDARHAIDAMTRAGMIERAARPTVVAHRLVPAFAVPSAVNRRAFEHAAADLGDALPAARLIGPLSGYGADPLNEQLFSGIRLAEEVCGAHV